MSTSDTKADMQQQGNLTSPATDPEDYVYCTFCHKLFKERKYMEKHVKLKHVKEKLGIDKEVLSKQELCQISKTSSESYCQETLDKVINTINLHTPETSSFTAKIKVEPDDDFKPILGVDRYYIMPEMKKEDDNAGDDNLCSENPMHVTCVICNKQFTTDQYLERHMNLKHQMKMETETISQSNGIEVRNDTGDCNQIECRICGQYLESIMDYTKHIEVHLDADESSFQQNHEIKTEFPSSLEDKIQAELFVKIDTTGKRKTYSCTLCKKSFPRIGHLKGHVNAIHLKRKDFPCTLCDKSFSQSSQLKTHIDGVHHKLKPFSCTLCDTSFAFKAGLAQHVATVHNKLKPFSCTLCDKSFTVKASLTAHFNVVHDKSKAFPCTLCDNVFASKKRLTRHTDAVHLKLKPVTCTLCDKSFAQKSHLNSHVKLIHHQDPFSCTLCDNSFEDIKDLTSHVNAVHSRLQPFPCTFCNRSFTEKKHMLIHRNNAHK